MVSFWTWDRCHIRAFGADNYQTSQREVLCGAIHEIICQQHKMSKDFQPNKNPIRIVLLKFMSFTLRTFVWKGVVFCVAWTSLRVDQGAIKIKSKNSKLCNISVMLAWEQLFKIPCTRKDRKVREWVPGRALHLLVLQMLSRSRLSFSDICYCHFDLSELA